MTETSYAGTDLERPQQSTAEGVKEKAEQVTGQMAEKAGDVRRQAAERTREQVDARSTQAGEQIAGIADALRRTGGQLREEGKGQPAGLAESAADRVESLGSYLRESDADRILDDVERFARSRPWIVGAGGLVVGLVASRLLKASSSRRYERSSASGSYGSYSASYTPSAGTGRPATYGVPVPEPADAPVGRSGEL